jgi:hypothetical protein
MMQNKKRVIFYSILSCSVQICNFGYVVANKEEWNIWTPLGVPAVETAVEGLEKMIDKNLPKIAEKVDTAASSMEKGAEILGKALGSEAAGKVLEAVKIMAPVANGAVKVAGVCAGVYAVKEVYSMGKDIVLWCNQSPEETARQKLSEANYKRAYEMDEAKGNFTKCLIDTINSGKTVKTHEGLPCRCEKLANIYAALAGKQALDRYRDIV